jgi:hypothetical protein
LIAEHKIPLLSGLSAADVLNLDEIGFDPNGQVERAYSLTRDSERRYCIRTGEKAPFWVSVILIALANGTMLPPIVIHKGGSDNALPAHFVNGLDPTFYVHCTSSGYADKDCFKIAAKNDGCQRCQRG